MTRSVCLILYCNYPIFKCCTSESKLWINCSKFMFSVFVQVLLTICHYQELDVVGFCRLYPAIFWHASIKINSNICVLYVTSCIKWFIYTSTAPEKNVSNIYVYFISTLKYCKKLKTFPIHSWHNVLPIVYESEYK